MQSRIWTLEEARSALPEIKRITEAAFQRSADMVRELEGKILPENEQEEREEQVQAVLTEWVQGIVAVGVEAKGLWLVDFDNGSGYYCWKLGEQDVLFEHTYEEGFAGRKRIEE